MCTQVAALEARRERTGALGDAEQRRLRTLRAQIDTLENDLR